MGGLPTKYRYKVLTGALRLRVRDICRQVCAENEVDILPGVLSTHAQLMILAHHFLPRVPSNWCEASAKKSRSTTSWPILECSLSTSAALRVF
jgi:hypothetical protein